MRWFTDRGVTVKILTAVVVAAMVAGVIGVLGLGSMSSIDSAGQGLYNSNIASLGAEARMADAATATQIAILKHGFAQDAAGMAAQATAIDQAAAAFTAATQTYLASGPAAPAALTTRVSAEYAHVLDLARTQVLPLSQRNDFVGFEKAINEVLAPAAAPLAADLATMHSAEIAEAHRAALAAHQTYTQSLTLVVSVLIAGVLLALALGTVVARMIVRSLSRVRVSAEALAHGDLTVRSHITSRDEVGAVGRAMDTAIGNLTDLVSTIGGSASSLAAAAEELTTTSGSIAASAQQTADQAEMVAGAAEQVSLNVQTVATGSNEMDASIREIARSTSEAAQAGSRAVDVAAATNATVAKLDESSLQIATVVKVITSIAEQTNLLALNATIEAARAGEAGKGFAVVAAEVKDLAQETARATEEISSRVLTIQSDTADAVTAIAQISDVIGLINDFQVTIASAVEEQTATTNEMNRNVSEAATGSGQIAANITGVATAAQLTTAGVTQSQQAVTELAQMSADLHAQVSKFHY